MSDIERIMDKLADAERNIEMYDLWLKKEEAKRAVLLELIEEHKTANGVAMGA